LEAISILKKCGSIEYAKEKAREIVRESWERVDKIFPQGKPKERLKELIEFLIERKL